MDLERLVEKSRLRQLERRFECEMVLIPPLTTKAETVHEEWEVSRPKMTGMDVKIVLKFMEKAAYERGLWSNERSRRL